MQVLTIRMHNLGLDIGGNKRKLKMFRFRFIGQVIPCVIMILSFLIIMIF